MRRNAWICPHMCLRKPFALCFAIFLFWCTAIVLEMPRAWGTTRCKPNAANLMFPWQCQGKELINSLSNHWKWRAQTLCFTAWPTCSAFSLTAPKPSPRKQFKLTRMKGPLAWTASPTSLHISPYKSCKHHLLILTLLGILDTAWFTAMSFTTGSFAQAVASIAGGSNAITSTQQHSHSCKAKLFQHVKQPAHWKAAVLTACCMHRITNKHSNAWGHSWEAPLSPMKTLLRMVHLCSESRNHAQI